MECWTSAFSTPKMGGNHDGRADSATASEPPVAIPFGDMHTAPREEVAPRFRRVLQWARTDATSTAEESDVTIAVERAPESTLGLWVLWNPALVLFRLLGAATRVRDRQAAGRFDGSTTTKTLPEAVGDEGDDRVERLDISHAARFRQQSPLETAVAWAPWAGFGLGYLALGRLGLSLLVGFVALVALSVGTAVALVAAARWTERRHHAPREAAMAGRLATLARESGPVVFFVGDDHVGPVCEQLNERGIETPRHPESRYGGAGEGEATGEIATGRDLESGDGAD
jgi:hypothetical protein